MDNMFTEGMMPGPDGAFLRFFYDSDRNEAATVASGRAVFDTILYCDVITPGQKVSTPRFEIERTFSEATKEAINLTVDSKRSHKYNELREWVDKFKANEAAHDFGGTPLKMWPRIDRGLQATLNSFNVFTVEALAELSDTNLQNLGMGSRELREQAKAWLEQAKGNSDTSKLVADNENLRLELQRVQGEAGAANSRIAELEAAVAKLQPQPSKIPDVL